MRTAIVTGGSSGIGFYAAKALQSAGCQVYELSRHQNEQQTVIHIPCDVTDEKQVQAAVERVKNETGTVDMLLCCAGFGISGAA